MQAHATATITGRAGSTPSRQTLVAQARDEEIEGREGVANMTGVFTVPCGTVVVFRILRRP
jgi:hypothetical protein